jgi:hypothetical protein
MSILDAVGRGTGQQVPLRLAPVRNDKNLRLLAPARNDKNLIRLAPVRNDKDLSGPQSAREGRAAITARCERCP